ncbi:hypothetical protein BS50DRAFT_271942 [Corynespora cassiicola Philippines]|uniref:Uncharacterized protein n=1 Tax=Corynespora cassiicola Philippines TaxID=1448308 RepID=A0A2T2P044_CORCC|nr:hypothetical protein BS50DRAFT_271942 [Corynespora cassiicola Philippines]
MRAGKRITITAHRRINHLDASHRLYSWISHRVCGLLLFLSALLLGLTRLSQTPEISCYASHLFAREMCLAQQNSIFEAMSSLSTRAKIYSPQIYMLVAQQK